MSVASSEEGIIVVVTGNRVSSAFDSLVRPEQNDMRSTAVRAADFIRGIFTEGQDITSWSGCIITNASGLNLSTLGGTGSTRYIYSN